MKKKLILSTILVAGICTVGVPQTKPDVVYAAENTQSSIQTSVFQVSSKDLAAYDQAFKIPATAIQAIKNNGGQYTGDRTIDKAIDGNPNTFWETGKPNNATFKNQFEVTFKEAQTFNRMTYATRQDGAKPKGFPKAFDIYASSTDAGDDYQLVGKGSSTNVTASTVVFQFNKITAKRIKFVFQDAHLDWTSASEIGFYKQDKLTDVINNVFTDKTNTKLSPAYRSEAAIRELEKLLTDHPMKATYEHTVKTARDILTNPNLERELESKLITLEQLGNPRSDAWDFKQQCYQLGSLLPTGLYYKPGETFIVDVDVAEGDPRPAIAFDQNWNIKGGRTASHTLQRGLNIITAPKDAYPGGVYFINESTPSQQKYAPKISIKSGGEAYPIFYSGKTDINEYKKQLAAYKEKMDQANVNGNIVMPNLANTVTDHVLTIGKATDAYNSFIKGSTSPQASANAWEDMIMYDYKLLGYSKNATAIKHQIPRNRLHARAVTDGMYAGGGLIGIGYGAESILFGTNLGWGAFHETGHVVEMGPLRFLELTNNLFSLANQERVGESIRIETDTIYNDYFNHYTSGKTLGFTYQKRPDAEVNLGGWEAHMVLWQLRTAFGYDFFTDIFKTGRDTNFKAGNTPADRWARLGSDSSGYDLGTYLHRMGMAITQDTLDYTAKYKKLDLAIQYADTNARLYKGNGFAAGYESKIADVAKEKDGVRITVDNKDVKNDIMGFEVYRDGKLIGYTNKASYLDKTVGDATNVSYQVKAFDRKLKAATMSKAVAINLHAPIFTANIPAITLKLNQTYEPLDYVTATTFDGKALTDQIKVLSNTVNTKLPGDYTIEYTVSDTAGNKQTFKLPVKVEYDFTYASDIDWKQITNSYGKTQKDRTINGQQIKLTNGIESVVYKKGLGTHANSTIVYDVTNKAYDSFEAIIGVEHNIVANNNSSIVFSIYVDGEKQYDSGLMKFTTPQKLVRVNIAGAHEVKLMLSDGGNGDAYDHGAWADAKFISVDPFAQEKSDLQALLTFAKPITSLAYVKPSLNHQQIRFDNLVYAKAQAEKLLTSKEATKQDFKTATFMLNYSLEEIGQTYKANTAPIKFK